MVVVISSGLAMLIRIFHPFRKFCPHRRPKQQTRMVVAISTGLAMLIRLSAFSAFSAISTFSALSAFSTLSATQNRELKWLLSSPLD
jgi:hypothetical protein